LTLPTLLSAPDRCSQPILQNGVDARRLV